MSERASKVAAKRLRDKGVKLLLNTKVDAETSRSLAYRPRTYQDPHGHMDGRHDK
jgi:hypothetical protein